MRLADIPLDPVDPIDPTGALVELVRAVRSYIVEPEPENGSKREVDPRISRQRLGELQSRYYPEHGDPRRMALQSLLWLARGFISRPGGEG